ncbi:MAG: RNA polymerase sigma factor [bacterium]|nr:RNA polymerase sigma factor [bacterium]MCM1375476.1 RNA polymerase sigma factor [Muribaculum sp.]
MDSSGGGYVMAFEEIMEKYGDMVYRICLTVTGNPEDAKDSFQETFLRLVRSRDKIKSEEHLKAWLIRVSTNCSRTIASSLWNRTTQGIQEEDMGESVCQPEQGEILFELRRLPDKYAVALYLFYYEEYSVREIARLMNKRENSVKTLLRRGRKQLKKKLEEGGERS